MGPETILIAAIALAGLSIGSFLNVVAWRLPRACMSIARPRSRCPRCSSAIAWYDNLPVVSWLLLRGRCRHCRSGISFRYPFVELLCGGLFVVVLLATWGAPKLEAPLEVDGESVLLLLGRLVATGGLLALSLIDLDHRILPDELTLGGIAVGLVLVGFCPVLQPSSGPFEGMISPRGDALLHGAAGALAGGGGLWLLGWVASRIFRKDAMGLGDVKMLAAMGAWLGFWAFLALLVACFTGAVVGVLVLLISRQRYIPFGPFLAVGAWSVMLAGPRIQDLWFSMFSLR